MAYQSLYRKYRPQRFAELVGQEHVTTALLNAVREGRVGHAYLFSGPRGTGKTTTARLLAKALNCPNRGADGDPCGVCETCTAIADGSSLDVMEVDAASRSRVDEMRDLLDRVAYSSAGGGKKVYILDEVHMLSASAEAALLKTLEESPEHVVFVLATTDPLKVAPTIRSRTQHFEFTLYTTDEIAAHLARVCEREGVAAEPEALAVVARAGAGSMRDSLSLLDQAMAHGHLTAAEVGGLFGGTAFDRRLAVLDAVADADGPRALVELAALLDGGQEPRRLTEDLLAAVRDAFLLAAGQGRVPVDVAPDDREHLVGLGDRLGVAGLARIIETLGQAVVDMRGTDAADPRLVLEVALLRVARPADGADLAGLVERVERLERAVRERPTVPASDTAAPAPARGARSLSALRREQPVAAEPVPPAEAAAPLTEPEPLPAAEGAPPAPVEIDDVIVAWAAILPELPPATRAAVSEAQPLSVEDDVITFGVPRARYEAALPRFRKEADTIRAALSARLGRLMKFKPVAHDGFDAPVTGRAGGAEPPVDDAPPPDDEVVDLEDATPADVAVDSVGLFTSRFDATVVEELPRD